MRSNFDDVGDFHEKFDLDNVTHRGPGKREVPEDLLAFRLNFMHEELDEYEEAMRDGDQARAFDALLDLAYVVFGTAHFLGFPWQAGWDEVQRANMTKVRAARDGSDSARGSGWDVVKPPDFVLPDIEAVLRGPRFAMCPQCQRDLGKNPPKVKHVMIGPFGVERLHCVCGHMLGTV